MRQNLLKSGRIFERRNNRRTYAFARFLAIWILVFSGTFFLLYDFGAVPSGTEEMAGSIFPEKGVFASVFSRTAEGSTGLLGFAGKRITTFFEKENMRSETAAAESPAFAREDPAPILPAGELFIPAVDLRTTIIFPRDAETVTLNAALLKGAVHYPYSALPGQKGNVFLLGHSTRLPVAKSSAYRAFNDIKKLKTGEAVQIIYGDKVYEYRTDSIRVGKAKDMVVDFRPDKKVLTLSTCWLFGSSIEEDRYVVEAVFVRSYPSANASSGMDTSS